MGFNWGHMRSAKITRGWTAEVTKGLLRSHENGLGHRSLAEVTQGHMRSGKVIRVQLGSYEIG